MTEGRGVDVILDMVGGDYIQRNLSAMAIEGRLIYIAFLGGPKAEVNFAPMLMKRLTITGATLRARPIAEKGAIAAAISSTAPSRALKRRMPCCWWVAIRAWKRPWSTPVSASAGWRVVSPLG